MLNVNIEWIRMASKQIVSRIGDLALEAPSLSLLCIDSDYTDRTY
jgi:hypothetical protein